ncbi:MAG: redox-sensing transcriptional repressor Rex [Acidimicrobiia bacterium]
MSAGFPRRLPSAVCRLPPAAVLLPQQAPNLATVKSTVPAVTVQRLPVYLRCLDELPPDQTSVSSEELATRAGVNSAKVRKDLSYLGSYGVRGVGYDTEHLRFQISMELGLTRDWAVVIVGIGNLGRALANYDGFGRRRFEIVGLFDSDQAKVGTRVDSMVVESMEALAGAVADRGASIGIITTPASVAQEVADAMAAAGIRSILNFAPTVIKVPEGVEVRRVDLSTELQVLAYYLNRS